MIYALDERYLTQEEYPGYFSRLNGLRTRIVRALPIKSNMKILDLATGYGYFALELAAIDQTLSVTGIDLAENVVLQARASVDRLALRGRVSIEKMDAADMGFESGRFDLAVNFLGLEDIHMTRGRFGVQQVFNEVHRVLKPLSCFGFVVMPPDEMETEAQKLQNEVFSYVCNATFLNMKDYDEILHGAGFVPLSKRGYYTNRRLSPEQAQEEIRCACDNVQRVYGIPTPRLDEVWEIFGERIEEHGMGLYSKVVLVLVQRI
jgi:ubiquinone/menaquinone biosynthesis C-methylase UbiE